jgi:site-specific DNA-methyltransferase (adenine-specific)
MDELPKLPSAAADMILTDLPYGTTRNPWDCRLPLDKLWREFGRVVKADGAVLLFAQTPFDKVLGMSNLKLLRYEWIWQKPHGRGHLNARRTPLKSHENILVFYKRPPPYFPQMTEGEPYRTVGGGSSANYGSQKPVLTANAGQRYPVSILKANSDRGLHPTQKPVALCEYFIKTYTQEGDTVLDCCMGSGTAGVAAVRLGRKFIGIEKDPTYYRTAQSRIEEINAV